MIINYKRIKGRNRCNKKKANVTTRDNERDTRKWYNEGDTQQS